MEEVNFSMNKQVKILTFCINTSIGSILQTYGLTAALKNCGYDSEVWLEVPKEYQKPVGRNRLKVMARDALEAVHKRSLEAGRQKRECFITEHIAAAYFAEEDDYRRKALEYEDAVYLAGSDQVWDPERLNPVFFLSFVTKGKRISYAASMGTTNIRPEAAKAIETWLRLFDRISVRERLCAEALRKLTDKEISMHIDPTFLIDVETWRSIEKPYRVKGPYILLYMLYWDNSLSGRIADLKKRTGLFVYAVCLRASRIYADKHCYDVGVEEFLWLVDHAEYVVTSSFHGVAFSVIFQKQFSAVINPKLPSRIENIFELLSLPRIGIEELGCGNDVDYSAVSEIIREERQRGITYLKEAIG